MCDHDLVSYVNSNLRPLPSQNATHMCMHMHIQKKINVNQLSHLRFFFFFFGIENVVLLQLASMQGTLIKRDPWIRQS